LKIHGLPGQNNPQAETVVKHFPASKQGTMVANNSDFFFVVGVVLMGVS